MVGTEDRLVRDANSYMLQRVRFLSTGIVIHPLCSILPQTLGCRLIKLERAGHGLPGECAKEINDELLGKSASLGYGSNDRYLTEIEFYENIRINGSPTAKREVPKEYQIEIQALEQCCQHRTHCLVYNLVGLIQGLCLGMLLSIVLGLTRGHLHDTSFHTDRVILVGCLK